MTTDIVPGSLVKRLGHLASPPTTYCKLVSVIDDPFSSAEKIASVISEDPDFSARLLRLVNSSFYSFPRKIENITHAVALVGNQQIRDLASIGTVITRFKDIPGELINMEEFWRHSVACAALCQTIAYRARNRDPERYFIAGLLHDVGRLVMYLTIPGESRLLLEESRRSKELLHLLEQKFLKFDHGDVGAALFQAWNLPEMYCEVVRCHHRPMAAASSPTEVAVVHTADVIANALELGSSGNPFVPPLDPQAWEALTLGVDSIGPIVEEAQEKYESTLDLVLEFVK